MKDFSLCRELSRKVCKDLGVTPYSVRKVSLTHPELMLKETVKISDENGLVKKIPMWYGEARGSNGLMCCLLTVIDENIDNFEMACIIGFKNFHGELQQDATMIGFRYDWSNDSDEGTIITKLGDKWMAISLSQRLLLALGLENMVQDGITWNPGIPPAEFKNHLSEIIEVDN